MPASKVRYTTNDSLVKKRREKRAREVVRTPGELDGKHEAIQAPRQEAGEGRLALGWKVEVQGGSESRGEKERTAEPRTTDMCFTADSRHSDTKMTD